MALLETSNLSKIYTTDNNISVGISNVNLMFDKNEIVAITGGSGSGKSTLLRVLGGLESYEEGEMYFNGMPTSHYTQDEWSEYLNNNISFIFQEYNILDSFTVLDNVMYALTDIKNKKERKARATEIIEKVGLKDRIKSKGSQLSGGEKQRTVIARAIAKDSPIVLADEPTGNLDSNTANDIINLLKDISKDKLVVIVTHNYEDIKRIATRHIRLFDGKVELDEGGSTVHESSQKTDPFDFKEEREYIFKKKNKNGMEKGLASDALALGFRRYTSRPKQNFLTMFLMIVAALLIFITCVMMIPGRIDKGDLITQPGRLLVIKNDGTEFNAVEVSQLAKDLAAKESIICDGALDRPFYEEGFVSWNIDKEIRYKLGYDLNYQIDEGETIKAPGEVVLKVPYTQKGKWKVGDNISLVGKYSPFEEHSMINADELVKMTGKVVGLSYYVGSKVVYVDMHKDDAQMIAIALKNPVPLRIVEENNGYMETKDVIAQVNPELTENEVIIYSPDSYWLERNYNLLQIKEGDKAEFYPSFNITIKEKKEVERENNNGYNMNSIKIDVSPEFYQENIGAYSTLTASSKQISLYFTSDKLAKEAAEALTQGENSNYTTFLASNYKEPKQKVQMALITSILVGVVVAFVIVLSLIKIISASKADVSIYRTMGISNNVIKGSTYVQVLLDTIPSILAMGIAYVVCFFTQLGVKLSFMSPVLLVALMVAMVVMGVVVAVGFNKVIYKEKINKGLRRTNK